MMCSEMMFRVSTLYTPSVVVGSRHSARGMTNCVQENGYGSTTLID